MLTFDTQLDTDSNAELEALFNTALPEVVEVGENELYWINVNRATKRIELTSKQTGEPIVNCTLEEAEAFGLSKLQLKVAEGALRL